MRYQTESVATPPVESTILLIREQRVLLNRDLAAMYGVTTGNFTQEGGTPYRVKPRRK